MSKHFTYTSEKKYNFSPALSLVTYRGPTEEHLPPINMTGTELQTEKNEAYRKLSMSTPTTDYDYVRASELPDTARGLPVSQNPAYGKVSTRAEDDQDYYVNEGMGGAAEVRMTKNEAYGTSRQARSDNGTFTENETHQYRSK